MLNGFLLNYPRWSCCFPLVVLASVLIWSDCHLLGLMIRNYEHSLSDPPQPHCPFPSVAMCLTPPAPHLPAPVRVYACT